MVPDALRLMAPSAYLAGPGVLSELGRVVCGLGTRPLLVHGSQGLAAAEHLVGPSLKEAGVRWSGVEHSGHCTDSSLEMLLGTARKHGADVVIGIGGGKVLDATKGTADRAGVPCITVPTSAATCAAVTALTVFYDEEGRWLRGERLKHCPDAVLIDTDVLAGAPPRLLAAGIADALAKQYEVTLAASRSGAVGAATIAALALCRELKTLLDRRAEDAVRQIRLEEAGEASRLLSEAVILLPGLIGGLGGEANKLAAAHAIHNALTQIPSGSSCLHGELVGFGILVQLVLEGRSHEEVSETANRLAGLGVPAALADLGIVWPSGEAEEQVLTHALSARSLQHAFPDLDSEELRGAIAQADALAEQHAKPTRA